MAAKTASTRITADSILAALNGGQAKAASTFGDSVVDFVSDKAGSTVTGVSRISGALTESFNNGVKHFALEKQVQRVRSDAKLHAAASRAAERMNLVLGL